MEPGAFIADDDRAKKETCCGCFNMYSGFRMLAWFEAIFSPFGASKSAWEFFLFLSANSRSFYSSYVYDAYGEKVGRGGFIWFGFWLYYLSSFVLEVSSFFIFVNWIMKDTPLSRTLMAKFYSAQAALKILVSLFALFGGYWPIIFFQGIITALFYGYLAR